ncbi:MAG: hypothetical protein M1334_00730 [Patescibacteria group bacterium]|nr:hypothetical protein [Patescibacteria group bacterium]
MKIKKESLGKMAVFLVPSLKLKKRTKKGKIEDVIHNFLTKNFNSYTVDTGNIFGYWKENGKEEYDEHRRFTVAFLGKEKIPVLEKFIANIAYSIGEKCIYLETGEDAWLIYAKKSGLN